MILARVCMVLLIMNTLRYTCFCEKDRDSRSISSKKGKQRDSSGGKRLLKTSKFLKYPEVVAYLKQLTQAYPNVVKLSSIGTTHENRQMQLVTVGKGGSSSGKKPAFWIDAGIHSREWLGPATALYMLDTLVTDPSNANYTKKLTWYFLPVANPDGYYYSRKNEKKQSGKEWRKNRRPAPSNSTCMGVDLNRNFDFSYGKQASKDPCEDDYMGSGPFSEPESQAIRDFLLKHKDIKAAVTLHTYGQSWFYPYGHKKKSPAKNWQEMKELAIRASSALKAYRGTTYTIGTAADLLYPSGGGSDDWTKSATGVKYMYCLELPPKDEDIGFFPSPTEIVPTGEETWAGMKVIADELIGGKSKKSGRSKSSKKARSG